MIDRVWALENLWPHSRHQSIMSSVSAIIIPNNNDRLLYFYVVVVCWKWWNVSHKQNLSSVITEMKKSMNGYLERKCVCPKNIGVVRWSNIYDPKSGQEWLLCWLFCWSFCWPKSTWIRKPPWELHGSVSVWDAHSASALDRRRPLCPAHQQTAVDGAVGPLWRPPHGVYSASTCLPPFEPRTLFAFAGFYCYVQVGWLCRFMGICPFEVCRFVIFQIWRLGNYVEGRRVLENTIYGSKNNFIGFCIKISKITLIHTNCYSLHKLET